MVIKTIDQIKRKAVYGNEDVNVDSCRRNILAPKPVTKDVAESIKLKSASMEFLVKNVKSNKEKMDEL